MQKNKAVVTVLCATALLQGALGRATSTPLPSLRDDRLNFYALILGTQDGTSLVWDGGRNGVFAGESVFIESRSPSWLQSLDLNTSLSGDNLSLSWSFSGFKTPPPFPITMQQGTVSMGTLTGETVPEVLWNEARFLFKSRAVTGK